MHGRTVNAPVQVHTSNKIAPLIRATNLQHTVVAATQLHVVVCLQQHVGELGVGDAVIFQTTLHRVTRQHGGQGEVFTHITQEGDHGHFIDPVSVVRHNRGVLTFKGDEALELTSDTLRPITDSVGRVHGALPHITWIPYHACSTTSEHDRTMTSLLETTQHEQRDEVAGVQGRSRRVKSCVQGDRRCRDFPQGIQVSGLIDQSAPL